MILNFISEFIVQLIVAIFISIIVVNYFFIKYKIFSLLLLIPMLTILFLFISNSNINLKKFNSTKWKNNIHYREKMVQNIVKDKNFIGKTKEEIISILGEDFKENSNNRIFYLVNEQYFPSYFYLKFKNNKVTEMGVFTD